MTVVVPRSISTSHNFNDVKWFLHRSLKLVGCRQLPSRGHSGFLTVIASYKNVIYQATVTTETWQQNHTLDSVATNFKAEYRNHLTSLRHANRRNETELSKQVWTLKDGNRSFHVQGKVLRNCKPYDQASINCNLCLQEKFFIICKNYLCTLKKKKTN